MPQELIAGAANEFVDAAYELIEPKAVWDAGTTRWQHSLYQRLATSLTAATTRSAAASPSSRPPCRIDILTLTVDIDRAVAAWWPDAHTTPDRLRKMVEHHWTPTDINQLHDHTRHLATWTVRARELLGDTMISIPLRKPCPNCGTLWHHSGSENVRAYALRASDHGADCLACKATWTTDQYPFLARLLT